MLCTSLFSLLLLSASGQVEASTSIALSRSGVVMGGSSFTYFTLRDRWNAMTNVYNPEFFLWNLPNVENAQRIMANVWEFSNPDWPLGASEGAVTERVSISTNDVFAMTFTASYGGQQPFSSYVTIVAYPTGGSTFRIEWMESACNPTSPDSVDLQVCGDAARRQAAFHLDYMYHYLINGEMNAAIAAANANY